MSSTKLQMTVFSLLSAAATAGCLAYIFIEQPDYLRATRAGVPYFTPPVINPLDGKPLDVNTLVRHYTGKDKP